MLNVTQDHLDWHGTMDAYVAAKARIFGGARRCVVNRDDAAVDGAGAGAAGAGADSGKARAPRPAPRTRRRASALDCAERAGRLRPASPRTAWPGSRGAMATTTPAPSEAAAERGRSHLQRLMPADALRIRGRHNALNALAALALATRDRLPAGADAARACANTAASRTASSYVARVGEVDAFDDSKGTNVGATVAALNGLGAERRRPARGDPRRRRQGPGFRAAGRAAGAPRARGARRSAATRPRSRRALAATRRVRSSATRRCEAVHALGFAQAHAGDAVLLSPACASLDMFRNYAHRAEVFVAAVQRASARRSWGAHGMNADGAAHGAASAGRAARGGASRARRGQAGTLARRRCATRCALSARPAGARCSSFDAPLVCVVSRCSRSALVMVYSASVALPDNPSSRATRRPISCCATCWRWRSPSSPRSWRRPVPMQFWEKRAPSVFVLALLLLVVVLIPCVGKGVNGARRWIPLGVHELPAVGARQAGIVLYAAGYMVRKQDVKQNFCARCLPMASSMAVVGLLLLAEPDMGAFGVIAAIAMGILFLGGVNGRMFLLHHGGAARRVRADDRARARGGASASSPTSTRGTSSTRSAAPTSSRIR